MPLTDKERIDVLLKQYDTLRSEILDRMKTAYSHLGYAGAIVAFIIPLSRDAEWYHVLAGSLGVGLLLWISAINWLWLRNCASHLRRIEGQVHGLAPCLLNWETRSARLVTWILLPPKSYEELFGVTAVADVKKCDELPLPECTDGK